MQILTVDVGTGTQDVLLFDSDRELENCFKLVLPSPTVVVKVPGVNHLLVPATTGEIDEYGTLPDKHVSSTVSTAIVSWLGKTLTAAR